MCPNAIWMQYVNPMCSNMIAIKTKYPEIKSLGLCHSVQGTAEMLAQDLGEDINDIDYPVQALTTWLFIKNLTKKILEKTYILD